MSDVVVANNDRIHIEAEESVIKDVEQWAGGHIRFDATVEHRQCACCGEPIAIVTLRRVSRVP